MHDGLAAEGGISVIVRGARIRRFQADRCFPRSKKLGLGTILTYDYAKAHSIITSSFPGDETIDLWTLCSGGRDSMY